MQLPSRKHTRLKNYDYSQSGCYFVTVCLRQRRCLLCDIVKGDDVCDLPNIILTSEGNIVDKYINNIDNAYESISVDKYIIMPDHIHLLIRIKDPLKTVDSGEMRASRPTLQTVIRSLKTLSTKEIGFSMWQESFYDHVIRNDDEYLQVCKYIDENPCKWLVQGNVSTAR